MRRPLHSANRFAVPAAALLLSLGCSAPSSGADGPLDRAVEAGEPAEAAGVSARRDGAVVVVRNAGAAPVEVGAIESRHFQESLALWCFGSRGCGAVVAAGAELRIPLRDVPGYEAGDRTVLVFWWPADPALSPAERAAAMRRLEVPVG